MFTIHKLLEKKMDRKEFLTVLGIVMLTVTGISGMFKTLRDPNLFGIKGGKVKKTFGTGPYGV